MDGDVLVVTCVVTVPSTGGYIEARLANRADEVQRRHVLRATDLDMRQEIQFRFEGATPEDPYECRTWVPPPPEPDPDALITMTPLTFMTIVGSALLLFFSAVLALAFWRKRTR